MLLRMLPIRLQNLNPIITKFKNKFFENQKFNKKQKQISKIKHYFLPKFGIKIKKKKK